MIMKTRILISELEPSAYKAMMEMEKYVAGTGIDAGISEMVRLRASQINGCAFCIEMHQEGAQKNGIDANKLFALSAWWESPLFTDKEKALLAFVDEVTEISNGGVSDGTFASMKQNYSDNEIAQFIMLIGLINTWNRMAISTHMMHK